MKINNYVVTIGIFLLLMIASCAKKQDLVDKAFADKEFDHMLPDSNQKPEDAAPGKEESDEKTKIDVIVDNIVTPRKESVFMETGSAERPTKVPFKNDPWVPDLKFDETPLYDVVQTLLNALEVNYIIDPVLKDQAITLDIKGGDRGFKASDLLDLVLKLHEITMVVHDNYVHIVPITNPEVNPQLKLLHGSEPNKNLRKEELAIQLVPLKYVAPADVNSVIKEFLSPSSRVYEEPKNNVLIIIDKYQYIEKAMELIPIFDVDVLANKKMVFYQLAFVDAVDIANQLQEILTVYGYEADGERLTVTPIESLNGILVVSTSETIFDELNFWIEKFDKEAQFEEDQIFVYEIENTTADSIAYTVSQVLGLRTQGGFNINQNASNRRSTSPGGLNRNNQNDRNNPNDRNNLNNSRNNSRNNSNLNNQNRNNNFNNQNQFGNRGFGNTLNNNADENAPIMVVDQDNNSLIFLTSHREYSRIYKTLRKLDVLPRQVFLEVTVLNVELRDSFQFGITWQALDDETSNTSSATSTDRFGVGFPLNTAEGSSLPKGSPFSAAYSLVGPTGTVFAQITAAKNKGYANVLQQPHIMAIDNKTASISVGTDIPISTSTTNISNIASGNGVNPAVSSSIQYRSTGVNLNFTPHINANGVIRLEIGLDISAASGDQGDSNSAIPISQNTLDTEMIVRDGQTAIMGGLIFDQENWSKGTVPFLGRIPIIKHLFSNDGSSQTKQEMVVMITPRLIDSEEKSIEISKEFKEKILKEFESFKKTRD